MFTEIKSGKCMNTIPLIIKYSLLCINDIHAWHIRIKQGAMGPGALTTSICSNTSFSQIYILDKNRNCK